MNMKRLTIRVAIAAWTFIIGVVTAILLNLPATNLSAVTLMGSKFDVPIVSVPEAIPDTTIYSVKFCDLVRKSKRYDGKIVRIQAVYWQGIDTSSLGDSRCDASIRPTCSTTNESCWKTWESVFKILLYGQTFEGTIDAIGRYTADAKDPDPFQGNRHEHTFEILKLEKVEPMPLH